MLFHSILSNFESPGGDVGYISGLSIPSSSVGGGLNTWPVLVSSIVTLGAESIPVTLGAIVLFLIEESLERDDVDRSRWYNFWRVSSSPYLRMSLQPRITS
jgi:hypothetical protein